MKRIIFLFILSVIVVLGCSKNKEIDDVCEKISDVYFIQYCYDNFDLNKDGKVSLSEANAVKSISFHKKGISSLDGIEYFTQLTYLNCRNNSITSLDLNKCIALTELNCGGNHIETLEVSKCSALTDLSCDGNKLATLDVSKCITLTYLYCENNNLTTLDVSSCNLLIELVCSDNKLTTLDVSNCSQLGGLDCRHNTLLTKLWLREGQEIYTIRKDPQTVISYK